MESRVPTGYDDSVKCSVVPSQSAVAVELGDHMRWREAQGLLEGRVMPSSNMAKFCLGLAELGDGTD